MEYYSRAIGYCGRVIKIALVCSTVPLLCSCTSAAKHHENLPTTQERQMTLGVVQRDIYPGMSQAELAEALGSPNIVTRDSEGNEAWIYDKIATEASFSRSSNHWTLILFGGQREAGASSSTQRTLTVVVKFDEAQQIDTVSYHSSRF